MIARLWASQIVKGNKAFEEVPSGLREQVGNLLAADGYQENQNNVR